jgi:hypothetical protein
MLARWPSFGLCVSRTALSARSCNFALSTSKCLLFHSTLQLHLMGSLTRALSHRKGCMDGLARTCVSESIGDVYPVKDLQCSCTPAATCNLAANHSVCADGSSTQDSLAPSQPDAMAG